ncbi:MAG TPA: hypothetical protein VN667_09845, partial [Burkholderiales bacterium]|nr:hypothetical protein [Burkholderiales bacterium]
MRDAIVTVLEARPNGASLTEITQQVEALLGGVPASSVRSYLQLNTPSLFARMDRAQYVLNGFPFESPPPNKKPPPRTFRSGKAVLLQQDCLSWLEQRETNS